MHPSDPEFNPIRDLSREDYFAMKEAEEYEKCSCCLVHVPRQILRTDPVFNDAMVCPECLKNIREEIDLNRKTPKEL